MICVREIGDLVDKELRFRNFRCLVREASAAKISASAFRLKSKKTKRLATSTISIRQALNC
jgi:histone H3/H4